MITCSHYHGENLELTQFCGDCGKVLRTRIICPQCGYSNPPRNGILDEGSKELTLKKLCKTADIPLNELRQFELFGQDILVANVSGQFRCLAARCTHAGAPLVKGVLKGEELECPWHDASFRTTDGTVIYGPPEKPLHIFPCKVKGEYLFVNISPSKRTAQIYN